MADLGCWCWDGVLNKSLSVKVKYFCRLNKFTETHKCLLLTKQSRVDLPLPSQQGPQLELIYI